MLKLSKDCTMIWCLSSLKSQVVVKCLLTRNADGDITGCPDPFLGGRYSGSGAVLIVFYIYSGSITRKPRPSRWPECTASSARRCSSPIRWVWLSTRTMQQLGTGTKELLLIVVVELISRIILDAKVEVSGSCSPSLQITNCVVLEKRMLDWHPNPYKQNQ